MAATDSSPATASETSLRITRSLQAPPEEVFRAWTERGALETWFAPTPDYVTIIHDLNVRAGGRYRVEMRSPEGKVHIVSGTYREVTRPTRLVYTWRWETESSLGDAETVVTLDFRAQRGGGTELTVTHEGFPVEHARNEHNKGWNGCLDRLARFTGKEEQ